MFFVGRNSMFNLLCTVKPDKPKTNP